MAKTKKPTKKDAAAPVPAEPQKTLDQNAAHELLKLPGPYDPPPPPIQTKGYATFWDPGVSIGKLRELHRSLFFPTDFLEKSAVMKQTDSWKWKQMRIEPLGPELAFRDQEEQLKKLGTVDVIPSAREVVTYLVLTFLTTGSRPDIGRWRCRDVLPSGRRVIVGPFLDLGLDLGSVADDWTSPGIALGAIFVPQVKYKR